MPPGCVVAILLRIAACGGSVAYFSLEHAVCPVVAEGVLAELPAPVLRLHASRVGEASFLGCQAVEGRPDPLLCAFPAGVKRVHR